MWRACRGSGWEPPWSPSAAGRWPTLSCICVYICIYVYIYIYIYIYLYIYIYTSLSLYIYIYIYHIYIVIYIFIYILSILSLSLYIYIYICIYTHASVYHMPTAVSISIPRSPSATTHWPTLSRMYLVRPGSVQAFSFYSFHQLDTGGAVAARKPLKRERRTP